MITVTTLTLTSCGGNSSSNIEQPAVRRVNKKRTQVQDTGAITNTKSDSMKNIQTITQVTVFPASTISLLSNNIQDAKYPDMIRRILEAKLLVDMQKNDKPRECYSDFFFSIYSAERTDSTIINFIDKQLDKTIKYLSKSIQFNYDALAGVDTTVKVYIKEK